MDESSARSWFINAFNVPRETLARLDDFIASLRAENELQNLVSRTSLESIWARHIADSAQLILHAGGRQGPWLDLGTGAGFPGLIVALLHPGPVVMIEERRKRADFLANAVTALGVSNRATIIPRRAEVVNLASVDVISARAFAPLGRLFDIGARFATPNTRWVLPKGRNAKTELEAAESSWQGKFRLEPSVTDAEAKIVVAEGVRRRALGKL